MKKERQESQKLWTEMVRVRERREERENRNKRAR